MCTVQKQLSELTKRTPIKFFIIGAQESTEYTVFSNLRQEGQEIPNLKTGTFLVALSGRLGL